MAALERKSTGTLDRGPRVPYIHPMTAPTSRPVAELVRMIEAARVAARQGRDVLAVSILDDAKTLAERLDREGYLVPTPTI